jgi:hypothetical protein
MTQVLQGFNVDLTAVSNTATSIKAKTDLLPAIPAFDGLTTAKQETVIATDVDGTTWKDLLDKSVITKPTRICGFKATVAGGWAGKAKIRITDGAGTKIWPFATEYVQDTDWTSAVQATISPVIEVPVASGYKVQFRSVNAADGAGKTLELSNLDVVEQG